MALHSATVIILTQDFPLPLSTEALLDFTLRVYGAEMHHSAHDFLFTKRCQTNIMSPTLTRWEVPFL